MSAQSGLGAKVLQIGMMEKETEFWSQQENDRWLSHAQFSSLAWRRIGVAFSPAQHAASGTAPHQLSIIPAPAD